jgi:TP901 family phage tail tape measure protein
MATESLVLSINEKGALQVQRDIAAIGSASKGAHGSVTLLKGALAALAIAGISASVSSATQTIAKFSQEMSTVAGVIGDIDPTKFGELEAEARRLGATTRFTATQSAQGMVELARAGFSADQTLRAVGPTLMLAQAGAVSLQQAAEITGTTLAGFSLHASEAARVVDVLAKAANMSNSGVLDLGEAMSYVAPVSSTLRVGLEETAAAVELLSNAGIKGSRAGTNLTAVMRLMQSPTEQQTKVMRDLNLTQKDLDIGTIGLTQALENFRNSGASTAQIFEYFGRSASSAAVLLRGTTGQMQTFTAANVDAAGAAERTAAVMDDNLNGALLAVSSAWESVILSIGDQGPEDAATKGLRELADALRYMGTHIDSVGQNMVAFGVAVAAVQFAPLISKAQAATTSFITLQKAVHSGNAVMLGSAQATAMRTAAVAASAQAETVAALEVSRATAAKTAAMLEVIPAQNAQTAAIAEAAGAEAAYTALMQRRAALELQHAGQLQALAAVEAQNAVATEAAAAAQAKSAAASAAMTTGLFGVNLAAKATVTSVRALGAALLANPITVGLAALAAGAIAINTIFDKLEDKQIALEAAEEKAYKTKLDALQAQVQEIRVRKEAEVSLQNYLDGLDYENMLLAKGEDEREAFVSLAKAEEIARRELEDTEKESLTTKLLLNKALKQEQAMYMSIRDPLERYREELATLERLKAKGRVDDAQFAQKKAALQDQYGQTDKFDEYIAGLAAETAALKLNSDERKVRQELIGASRDVGRPLVGAEPQKAESAIREKLAVEQLQAAYQQIAGPQEAYAKLEKDLTGLVEAHVVSEQKKAFLLRQAKEALGGYDVAIARLQEEGRQLAMTDEARKKYLFTLQMVREAQGDVSQAQIDAAWAQEQLNQKQYDYNELVRANRSPMIDMMNEQSMLNRAYDAGDISVQRYDQRTRELKRAMEELSPATLHLSAVMDTAWGSAKSVLDDFVDTGIFRIKDLEFAVISSVTKMAAEFAMLQALKAAGNFITGGLDIGGLATGGSFMVGGSGGTDSQLVAFMASPDEQVDVTTPAQRAARDQGQQASGGVTLTIVNLIDPDDVPKAMAGRAGQDAILNVVSLNASTVRQMIS